LLGVPAIGRRATQSTLLQNRKHQLLGSARIGCGLEHHELAWLEVRLNGTGSLLDVGKIWFAALIQGSRHADDNRVHLDQAVKIAAGAEVLGADVLLNSGRRNMADKALAGV